MNSFIKFLLGGLFVFGLKLSLTWLLVEKLGLWYLYSYLICLSIIITIGYFYNVKITFVTNSNKIKFMKYILFTFLFLVLDSGVVIFLTEIISTYYLHSIFLSTCTLFIIKFFIYKKYVFEN